MILGSAIVQSLVFNGASLSPGPPQDTSHTPPWPFLDPTCCRLPAELTLPSQFACQISLATAASRHDLSRHIEESSPDRCTQTYLFLWKERIQGMLLPRNQFHFDSYALISGSSPGTPIPFSRLKPFSPCLFSRTRQCGRYYSAPKSWAPIKIFPEFPIPLHLPSSKFTLSLTTHVEHSTEVNMTATALPHSQPARRRCIQILSLIEARIIPKDSTVTRHGVGR